MNFSQRSPRRVTPQPTTTREPPVRFGVIGLNHNHIYAMTEQLLEAGGELVSFFAEEPELADEFGQRFPQARRARERAEVLEDDSTQLIVGAAIPDQRAPLGVEAMHHGKDYLTDKTGFTTLEQLDEVRGVVRETGRMYCVSFSERFQSRATVHAGELV